MSRSLALLFALAAVLGCVSAVRDVGRQHAGAKLNVNASGAKLRAAANRVGLQTPYGRIVLRLLPDNAPNAVAAVKKLAAAQGCLKCNFYRNEARPETSNPEGPPYGLLQGELDVPPVPLEGSLSIKNGAVAFIPDTSDFIIALRDHPEWGVAHTVVAMVEDFVSTDLIAAQPWHEVTHEEYGTRMRMMTDPVYFKISNDVTSY